MGITFKEIGDECDLCPLRRQNICNGLANYGGEPVFPPCSEIDPDTDAEQYARDILVYQAKKERYRRPKNAKKV